MNQIKKALKWVLQQQGDFHRIQIFSKRMILGIIISRYPSSSNLSYELLNIHPILGCFHPFHSDLDGHLKHQTDRALSIFPTKSVKRVGRKATNLQIYYREIHHKTTMTTTITTDAKQTKQKILGQQAMLLSCIF